MLSISVWSIWLVSWVSWGLGIGWNEGRLVTVVLGLRVDILKIVVRVHWLTITIVGGSYWLSEGNSRGIYSTCYDQFLGSVRNRCCIINDSLNIMMMNVLISQHCSVSLSAACSNTAWYEDNEEEKAAEYDTDNLARVRARIVAVIIAVIVIVTAVVTSQRWFGSYTADAVYSLICELSSSSTTNSWCLLCDDHWKQGHACKKNRSSVCWHIYL